MSFKFGIEQNGVLTALDPPTQMFLLSEGITIFTAVALAAELGIADLLANGPRSSDELAQATSTHPASLYRLLRLLSIFGIFSEVEPDRFAQTPLSELLRSGTPGSLRPWVRMIGLPVWAPIWAEAMHSVKTGEPSFKQTMGLELFDYLAVHPREGKIFNEAMSAFGQNVVAAVVQAYDFGSVRKIVDVGGGHGTLMSAILKNCRRAIDQAGRLLLIETVIPGPGEPHPGKIMDFVMMVGLGGQERTEQQYADLLSEAGFALSRVVPTASPMSVIEGVPI